MKGAYVRLIRAVRTVLKVSGVLAVLDVWARRSRTGAWVRSLFAIYDIEALVDLDSPWWTFASIDVVRDHLAQRPGARVLEWGSGASTVWLAKRAGHVTAIEHDVEWAERVRPLVGANVDILTVPPTQGLSADPIISAKPGHEGLDFTDYVHAVDALPGQFDLVVIDGRAREACLPRALARLAEGGMVVFDNVDRRRYRAALAAEGGIDVLVTRGLTPSLPYPTRTAVVTKTLDS